MYLTIPYRDDEDWETITLSNTEIVDDLWDRDPIDAGDAVEHDRTGDLDEINADIEQKSAHETG